jgi:hypothetical protein
VLVVVIAVLAVVAYLYKRRNHEPQVDNGDDSGTDRPPDGADQLLSLSPRPLIAPAEPQVVVETNGPPIDTELVTVFPKREGTPRHVRTSSLLRDPTENIGYGMTDPVDTSALDITTSSFVNSFSDERYDIKFLLTRRRSCSFMHIMLVSLCSETVQLSKEEESHGQSLSCHISGLDCTVLKI